MKYQIVDAKGSDYYNDTTTYNTLQEAQAELAAKQAWAAEESKREPTWKDAQFRIAEVSE